MSEEPPVAKLKLALIGKEKNGKSWLAASGRRPVLVHDFDNRAEALQGKPGVYVISYVEPQWPKQPEAAQKFLDILGKLEESLDLADLGFKVPKGTFVRTNVVDSIQTFGKAFQGYALYGQKDIRREITFGGMKVFLPGGWDAWNAEMVPVENSVLRLLALPTDTTIILHETAEETPDSTSEKPKFTGRVGVFPVRYQRLIKYMNEVWRVKLTQAIDKNNKSAYLPKVYPLPTYEFDAASAMLVDGIEEPNILAMIAKHEQRFALLPKELQTQQIESKKQLPAGVKI
jgi:inosine/xanthosine triphosphate pyrophosphatase family protein